MAGDAFVSGVRRVGPPTERHLLPWKTTGLAASFVEVSVPTSGVRTGRRLAIGSTSSG